MYTNTLFDMAPVCIECRDIGFVVKDGLPVRCWRKNAGAPHNAPNPAATILQKCVDYMQFRKLAAEPHAFEIARLLCRFDGSNPCRRGELIEKKFGYVKNSLRAFHAVVETLRRDWLLPVGSRKDAPSGYWIITTADEFAEWVARTRSAPITQLTTIHRLAKHNFPIFAEQLELDFWNDISGRPENFERLHAA